MSHYVPPPQVRRMAVDELSEAHQQLSEQYTSLASKHNGAKARVRTLEAESGQHRQQMKMVIAKTETDDRLIGALKAEVRVCLSVCLSLSLSLSLVL